MANTYTSSWQNISNGGSDVFNPETLVNSSKPINILSSEIKYEGIDADKSITRSGSLPEQETAGASTDQAVSPSSTSTVGDAQVTINPGRKKLNEAYRYIFKEDQTFDDANRYENFPIGNWIVEKLYFDTGYVITKDDTNDQVGIYDTSGWGSNGDLGIVTPLVDQEQYKDNYKTLTSPQQWNGSGEIFLGFKSYNDGDDGEWDLETFRIKSATPTSVTVSPDNKSSTTKSLSGSSKTFNVSIDSSTSHITISCNQGIVSYDITYPEVRSTTNPSVSGNVSSDPGVTLNDGEQSIWYTLSGLEANSPIDETFNYGISGSGQAKFKFRFDWEYDVPTAVSQCGIRINGTTHKVALADPTDPALDYNFYRIYDGTNGTLAVDVVDPSHTDAIPYYVYHPTHGKLALRKII